MKTGRSQGRNVIRATWLLLLTLGSVALTQSSNHAEAHFESCGQFVRVWEHNPVNYLIGASVDSGLAAATDDAAYVWDVYSDIGFASGLYDIVVEQGADVTETTGWTAYTYWENSGCQTYYAEIWYDDDVAGMSTVYQHHIASHELGHAIGMIHEPGSSYCSPDTVMLPYWPWAVNGSCSYEYIRYHDAVETNTWY